MSLLSCLSSPHVSLAAKCALMKTSTGFGFRLINTANTCFVIVVYGFHRFAFINVHSEPHVNADQVFTKIIKVIFPGVHKKAFRD